jgi:hypothetical protein
MRREYALSDPIGRFFFRGTAMTKSANQNHFASFEAYDPVRVLVCEDCCSKIAGCSQSFEEIFEWARVSFELMLIFGKSIAMGLFAVTLFFTSLFPRTEADQEADEDRRAKDMDLADIVDRQAMIRLNKLANIPIYDREHQARSAELQNAAATIQAAFGDPKADAGLLDCKLRQIRREQISLAEHEWNASRFEAHQHIEAISLQCRDLDRQWRLFNRLEQDSFDQIEFEYFREMRIATEQELHRANGDLNHWKGQLASMS